MTAPAPTPEAKPAPDFASLTKMQKLGGLLVMLGPEAAAHVLRGFPPPEVDAISAEMARLEIVPHALQQHLLQEFSAVALEGGTAVRGGVDFTRATLERALGQFKANEVINRVAPVRAPLPAMHTLADMESRQLSNLVAHEQPQTIALVLSYLSPEKAADVSALFPADLRERVIERLATLEPTPVEVVEKVIAVLTAKAGVRQTRALNQTGGVKTAAEILNAMAKLESKTLLAGIEKHNPDLTRAIRQKMFTFEDLTGIEVSLLQLALRDVEMRDLAMALKGASEKLKAMILGSISKRAAEGVREEIAFLTAVKPRDIEAAQMRIIEAVRNLETESEGDPASAESTGEAQHVAA